jgi:hypothetical protein
MNQVLLGTVRFKRWRCRAVLAHYHNGRPAIALFDDDDGAPVARATVNVPGVRLARDEVIVKDYAENTGMLEALVTAGIVTMTDRTVSLGHAVGQICRLVNVNRSVTP